MNNAPAFAAAPPLRLSRTRHESLSASSFTPLATVPRRRSVLSLASSFTPLATVPRRRSVLSLAAPHLPPMMTASKVSAPPVAEPGPTVTLERVVCKFGGSSLANSERLLEVTKLVKLQIERSEKMPIVVLSAMGKSTNELLAAGNRALKEGVVDMSTVRVRAYEACDAFGLDKKDLVDPLLRNIQELLVGVTFLKEFSPRTKDYLVSFGERLSVRILAAHLRQNEDINAIHVDAFEAGFRTNSAFTNAELKEETYGNVKRYFDKHVGENCLAVVTGFIAKDENDNITTLGRGGSDLTASVLGTAIGTSEVQVWKDVDGILSTDPRIVDNAIPIPCISFEEAAEMAFFGAKVLHPIAMLPAMRGNVPVRVKNSYNPDHPGTVIVRSRAFDSSNPVTAVSLKKNVQIVDVVSTRMLGASGFLAEVFKAFAHHKVSVDMIATSEVSISMTLDDSVCDNETLHQLKAEISEIAKVSFSTNNKAIITLVSDSSRSSGVVGRALTALDRVGIKALMISQGASKYNVSVTVEGEVAKEAVRAVHKEFFH